VKRVQEGRSVLGALKEAKECAVEDERKLVIRYLHDVAIHWQNEARLLAAKDVEVSRYAAAKCAVLEGVAADIHDGVHTRRPT
jgi:hypothetical protein